MNILKDDGKYQVGNKLRPQVSKSPTGLDLKDRVAVFKLFCGFLTEIRRIQLFNFRAY